MRGDRIGHSLADRILVSPITWLITALNLGIFIIAWIHGGHEGASLDSAARIAYGAIERYYVRSGEYWRLLTAVFLHGGWIHLLWNTWGMFGWCTDIEETVGSAWFAFAYLTTGIGASAVSLLGHHTISAGASGAGFGMLAVMLAILYRRERSWNNFISNPLSKNLMTSGAIWMAIGFLGIGSMDNYGHLGGFAFGMPCGLLLENRHGRNRPKWLAALAAYILVWAGVVVAACIPGLGLGRLGD